MGETTDGLDYHAARTLERLEIIEALVIASIDQSRTYRTQLEEQITRESGEVEFHLRQRKHKVEAWLERAEVLRGRLVKLNHEIPVLLRKAQMGLLANELEEVRRIDAQLEQQHIAIVDECVTAVGNGVWERITSQAEEIRNEEAALQQSEEFQQLQAELEDVETILHGDLDEIDANSADVEPEPEAEARVSQTSDGESSRSGPAATDGGEVSLDDEDEDDDSDEDEDDVPSL